MIVALIILIFVIPVALLALAGYGVYRLIWRRLAAKSMYLRAGLTVAATSVILIAARIALPIALSFSIAALTAVSPATAVHLVLDNHPEFQMIGRNDPATEKTAVGDMEQLAQSKQLNEGKVLQIYRAYIGKVARRADREAILRYGKAQLALFEASLNEGRGKCFSAIVGVYGPADIYVLRKYRDDVAQAKTAAYESGKTAPSPPDLSTEEQQALIDKARSLPQNPLSPQERQAMDDLAHGTTIAFCRAMTHLQSNIMALDEADTIAALREQIGVH